MLFYNIGYAQTLTNLLTVHGSNSYQDVSQNHCNFKKKGKFVFTQYSMSLGWFCHTAAHMSVINGHLLQF